MTKTLVPTLFGERVGILQDGHWLRVLSACCGYELTLNPECESDTHDYYECSRCELPGGMMTSVLTGEPLGPSILIRTTNAHLTDWVSSWLGATSWVTVVE